MRLSIDLGGTNIRIAQVEKGRCINKASVLCKAQHDANTVLNQISQLIEEFINEDVDGIGIGVPSIVDSKKGIVYEVANISSWKEVPLKDILEEKFNVPVSINNDSNCFALGESMFGEGKPYNNMVGVTIGTGIGMGIVINNNLYTGQYVGAGEIGSLPYLDSDYEHYCSSFFFKNLHNTTGEEAVKKAEANDKDALQLWHDFGTHLGNLMKAILFTYAPEAIVLGGGIVAAYPYFKESMEKEMQSFPYKIILNNVNIIVSSKKDVSLLGASVLCEEMS